MSHPSPQPRAAHAGATGRASRIAGHVLARARATAQTAYVIAPDVSHYQAALTVAYPRDFAVFKGTQGVNYLDEHFLVNAGVAVSLHAQGKLAGAVVYHVFSVDSPAAQFAKIQAAIGPTPPPWLAGVMIDLESWPGTPYEIRGDHSAAVNELGGLLAAWLGSWRRTWLYGNQYDLRALAPRRDQRMPVVVAAYTSQLVYTSIPGAIGQQYSDGETRWSVPIINGQPLPRTTPGLGYCDHNVFPGFADGTSLVHWMSGEQEHTMNDAQILKAISDAHYGAYAGGDVGVWKEADHVWLHKAGDGYNARLVRHYYWLKRLWARLTKAGIN